MKRRGVLFHVLVAVLAIGLCSDADAAKGRKKRRPPKPAQAPPIAVVGDQDPMPVGACTREDTRLLRIGRDDFYELLSDNAEITASIFSTLVKRFRKLVEQ